MLALDSPRWSELDTFFGEPENVPKVLAEWVESVGFDAQRTIYLRDLHELFLHQGTTTNVAYAIVPWLVNNLSRSELHNQASYLTDVGWVELRRLTGGVYFLRDGGEAEPSWLMPDYLESIQQAQTMAEDILDEPLPEEVRTPLWSLMPALFGNAELAQKRTFGE